MEIKDIIQIIVIPLVTLCLVIYNLYLVTKQKAMMEYSKENRSRIIENEKKVDSVRNNYRDRFDEVTSILHSIELNLVKVSEKIDNQKELCEKIQRNKKNDSI